MSESRSGSPSLDSTAGLSRGSTSADRALVADLRALLEHERGVAAKALAEVERLKTADNKRLDYPVAAPCASDAELDSPKFKPDSLTELEARGFVRVNRIPYDPEDRHARAVEAAKASDLRIKEAAARAADNDAAADGYARQAARLKASAERNEINEGDDMKKATAKSERAVIVTTEHRGVFFGYASDTNGDQIALRDSRLCLHWSADVKGFMGLAGAGPTKSCRIGPPADITLRKITAVIECTDAAAKEWENAPWNG